MGVCAGWTTTKDIPSSVWTHVQQDFERIATQYTQELKDAYAQERANRQRPWLSRMFMKAPPDPAFEILENSANKISVVPAVGYGRALSVVTPETQSWYGWELERLSGNSWCKTNVHYHDQLLFVALMLVEKQHPGNIVLAQNDYDFDVCAGIQAWVSARTGILLPKIPAFNPQ